MPLAPAPRASTPPRAARAGAERQPLRDAARDAHARERAGTGAEGDAVEIAQRDTRFARARRRSAAAGAPNCPRPRARRASPRRRRPRRPRTASAWTCRTRGSSCAEFYRARVRRTGGPVQFAALRVLRAAAGHPPMDSRLTLDRLHADPDRIARPGRPRRRARRRQGGVRRRRAARRGGDRARCSATSRTTRWRAW